MKKVIVGIGEILWDMLPSGKKLGGAPANFAFHAEKLGGRGVIVSSVGNDPDGDEIIGNLRKLELSTDYIERDAEHPTGRATVTFGKDGVPKYVIHENAAWDFIPGSEKLTKLAASSNCVCFGTLSQRSPMSAETVANFVKTASTNGALTICDINIRPPFYSDEAIHRSLDLCKILKISDEETEFLCGKFGASTPKEFAYVLFGKYGLDAVIVTRGANGSVIYLSDGRESEHPGRKVLVADTVGAGNAFTAAFAVAYMKGLPLDRINDVANRVSSFVCSRHGATPEIPKEMKCLFR